MQLYDSLLPKVDRFTHYLLGHKILDEQHRAIYDALCLIRDVKNPSPELVQTLLKEANDACKFHFLQEDLLMQLHNYPFRDSHLLVHATTEKNFFDALANYQPEIIDELIDALLYHIDWFDRQFVEYIKQYPSRRQSDTFNGINYRL